MGSNPIRPAKFMLKRLHKAISCEGKVRYGHQETAEKAVAQMSKKGSADLEAYNCRYCGGWHIGHSTAGWRVLFSWGGVP